jgi:hypothetical protein
LGECRRAILSLHGVLRGLEHFNVGLLAYNDRSNTFRVARRCEIVLHCDPKQIERIVHRILILEPASYQKLKVPQNINATHHDTQPDVRSGDVRVTAFLSSPLSAHHINNRPDKPNPTYTLVEERSFIRPTPSIHEKQTWRI